MPLHLRAEPGEVAPVVLMPGDPGRAELVASRLDDSRCYTRNRGLLGFTGSWNGTPVSVQTTGMGAPSAAIVAEELVQLGARVLVRIGTAGGVAAVRPGDLVVATAAVPLDGTTRTYMDQGPSAPAATFGVTAALADAARRSGNPYHTGIVMTDDVFYHPNPDHGRIWSARGVLAVEMEASAIFTVAALRGVAAGCLLLVSNTLFGDDWSTGVTHQQAVEQMIDVALAALPALSAV